MPQLERLRGSDPFHTISFDGAFRTGSTSIWNPVPHNEWAAAEYFFSVAATALRDAQPRIIDFNYLRQDDAIVLTGDTKQTLGEWYSEPRREPVSSEPVRLDWFADIHCGSDGEAPARSMTSMYTSLQAFLIERNYSMVNAILNSARIERLPPEAIVGLLRYTFAEKNKLSRWMDFLARASAGLSARGIDPARALRGLT